MLHFTRSNQLLATGRMSLFVKSGNLIVTKVPITWNGTDRQGKVKTLTRFAYVAVNVKTFLIDGVKNDDK